MRKLKEEKSHDCLPAKLLCVEYILSKDSMKGLNKEVKIQKKFIMN